MEVTIVNYWRDDNKGDSAILLGTLKTLQAHEMHIRIDLSTCSLIAILLLVPANKFANKVTS